MMNKSNKNLLLISGFAIAKLLLHFLSCTNYGFHRDEYLYLAEGQHLDWGFMEVPPLTPAIGWLVEMMGGGLFLTRLFPALIGASIIFLAGLLTKRLGGKTWAIIICCTGLLLMPALLGSNSLFQPVSFNQFFWFLSAYLLTLIVQTEDKKYWYFLGITIGFGLLCKYSIVFYGLGIAAGLLLTKERKILASKEPYIALGIALLIASPNIYWQIQHNIPLLHHMQELSESQLTHMDWGIYLGSMLSFTLSLTPIWIAAFVLVFRLEGYKKYRFLVLGFVLTIVLIGLLSGKAYYAIGAFYILFPLGGIAFEQYFKSTWAKALSLGLMSLIILPFLPYVLHILPIEKMKDYCQYMANDFGLNGQIRWEDGEFYDLPQDYADMHGWEELSQRVGKFHHSLPFKERESCMVYGGNYGHACSMEYYQEKYQLPRIHSTASSCIIWETSDAAFDRMILVLDEHQTESSWFGNIELIDSIQHPQARDPGYIYYRTKPKVNLQEEWKSFIEEEKERFNF